MKDLKEGILGLHWEDFFNHSDSPNCEAYIDGDFVRLRSIKKILEGEELTVRYWLYEL